MILGAVLPPQFCLYGMIGFSGNLNHETRNTKPKVLKDLLGEFRTWLKKIQKFIKIRLQHQPLIQIRRHEEKKCKRKYLNPHVTWWDCSLHWGDREPWGPSHILLTDTWLKGKHSESLSWKFELRYQCSICCARLGSSGKERCNFILEWLQ